jgi:putative chitinase
MSITAQQLLQILPNIGPVVGVFVPVLNRAMAGFKIDSRVRQGAFLA